MCKISTCCFIQLIWPIEQIHAAALLRKVARQVRQMQIFTTDQDQQASGRERALINLETTCKASATDQRAKLENTLTRIAPLVTD